MTWAVIGLMLFGVMLTAILLKESVTHNFWRTRAGQGDVTMISLLLEQEFEHWRTMRVPRNVTPTLWHGVQTVDLVAVGGNQAHVTCSAEGEYRIVGGESQEITSPLDAAMRLASKLCDLILYDIPNLRLSAVRVDVYSTFRDQRGAPVQRCILSTTADRGTADDMDWETLRPSEVLERFETVYQRNAQGIAEPIVLPPPMEGAIPVADVPPPPPEEDAPSTAPAQSSNGQVTNDVWRPPTAR